MLGGPARRPLGIEPQGGPNDMTVSVAGPGGSAR
jgi:hypothetical protein